MFSLPIVIRFNVFEDSGYCHSSSSVPFTVNELDFQCVEKTFHHSIVVTVRFAPHAAAQLIIPDQSLISLGTILTATIRMDDRAFGKVATEQCHGQRVADQLLRHASVH